MSADTLDNKTQKDVIDVGPLFSMQIFDVGIYHAERGDAGLKCCCNDGECQVRDLAIEKDCSSWRDAKGCGCLVGVGWKSFQNGNEGKCPLETSAAVQAFKKKDSTELIQAVTGAVTTRLLDEWSGSYGECTTRCGEGTRPLTNTVYTGSGDRPSSVPVDMPTTIPCRFMDGCSFACSWDGVAGSCGWGNVLCKDNDGSEGTLCDERATTDRSFRSRSKYRKEECVKGCATGDQMKSLCAITTNHLDEQYKSLDNLARSTCLVGSSSPPDMIIVMTQELNHANGLPVFSNDFPDFVGPNSLTGYRRSATCEPEMSANTAIYVREALASRVFEDEVECRGLKIRKCDWTNCKGNAIMGVYTTRGKLVVGNWHGARGQQVDRTRVLEFEQAATAILDIQPYEGMKHVIWAGDTNVRSYFPSDYADDLKVKPQLTPAEIRAVNGDDVLGTRGQTVDQHLAGTAGESAEVKRRLQEAPLFQVKGWDSLCPTYKKTAESKRVVEEKEWDGTYEKSMFGFGQSKHYIKKTVEYAHLACMTPTDQLAQGVGVIEYTDFKEIEGKKSRAPSWTERIFLSRDLYDSCGKAMKDTRNKQNDHDPMFVHCAFPDK